MFLIHDNKVNIPASKAKQKPKKRPIKKKRPIQKYIKIENWNTEFTKSSNLKKFLTYGLEQKMSNQSCRTKLFTGADAGPQQK